MWLSKKIRGKNLGEWKLGVIETWLSTFFVTEKFTVGIAEKMAARLGLEPRQNESESFVLPLHHRAVKTVNRRRMFTGRSRNWSRRWDSNPQPPVYKTGALPLSYAGPGIRGFRGFDWEKTPGNMVAPRGLEPRTY